MEGERDGVGEGGGGGGGVVVVAISFTFRTERGYSIINDGCERFARARTSRSKAGKPKSYWWADLKSYSYRAGTDDALAVSVAERIRVAEERPCSACILYGKCVRPTLGYSPPPTP